MATIDTFRRIALAFPGSTEVPHFEKCAFRNKQKIYATLTEATGIAVALLTPAEQYVFCKMDEKNIYPVPNKWGLKGATNLHIKNITAEILQEILESAYNISLRPSPSKK